MRSRSRWPALVAAVVLLAGGVAGAWRVRERWRPVVIELGSAPTSLAFSADGESIVAGSSGDVAWLVSAEAGAFVKELRGKKVYLWRLRR